MHRIRGPPRQTDTKKDGQRWNADRLDDSLELRKGYHTVNYLLNDSQRAISDFVRGRSCGMASAFDVIEETDTRTALVHESGYVIAYRDGDGVRIMPTPNFAPDIVRRALMFARHQLRAAS